MNTSAISRRSLLKLAAAAGVTALAPLSLAASATTAPVDTATGRVRGLVESGISVFRGIPYGTETGRHRFQPASPPAPWTGVKECFRFGARAPQGTVGGGARMTPGDSFAERVREAFRDGQVDDYPSSEECLFLNVFTPEPSPANRRPVLFWLHGGGFGIGSGGERVYQGHALARRGDVVVVTINHRLGAPGYLYLGGLHGDFADSGMVGQLDQVLALQWVRDNIAQFGGDPDNVTIFGESGGGAKVSTLLAMPPAQGLFHKAIIQSGAGLRMVDREDAEALAEQVLMELGVARGDVHRLLTMDLERIMAAAAKAAAGFGPGGRTLAPVVDGRSLPQHPFDPQAPEVSRNIPIIVGSTKDEATLFSAGDPLFGTMTEEQARQRFLQTLGDRGEAAFDLYRRLRPDDAPTYWVTSLLTEMRTWMDSIRLAERKFAQGEAPVYMYRLDWETPVFGGVLRSPHGLDTPLVFDNAHQTPLLTGPGPEPFIVAAAMSQSWINFARTGNPSLADVPWPAYDTASRDTMIFDLDSRVVADPDGEVRRFFSA